MTALATVYGVYVYSLSLNLYDYLPEDPIFDCFRSMPNLHDLKFLTFPRFQFLADLPFRLRSLDIFINRPSEPLKQFLASQSQITTLRLDGISYEPDVIQPDEYTTYLPQLETLYCTKHVLAAFFLGRGIRRLKLFLESSHGWWETLPVSEFQSLVELNAYNIPHGTKLASLFPNLQYLFFWEVSDLILAETQN